MRTGRQRGLLLADNLGCGIPASLWRGARDFRSLPSPYNFVGQSFAWCPLQPHRRQRSLADQSFGPATAAPSSESAGQEVSLPPSIPLSSPLSPPCMSPTLVELIQAHIFSNPLQVKQVRPESILPTKGTPGSAGYNLYAAADILIPSGGQQRVPTGLAFASPVLSYGKIQDTSGNASKSALRVGAGVIDHDYMGEVDILLSNQALRDHMVRQGDKVAQMTLELHLNPLVQQVTGLQATERGSGGFGSTDTPKGTDAFLWGAWQRDAAVDTHKQAGRQSTALTGASSRSCLVTKRFRILATLKQGNKRMHSNTSGYVHMGLRLDWGKGITGQ